MFWDKTFSKKMYHTHLLTTERKPMTGQSMAPNKAHLIGEPIHFIGVTYMNVAEGLLRRTEVTQVYRGCITKAHPVWVTTHEMWEPAAQCTACRQLNILGMSFPVVLVDLKIFLVLGSTRSPSKNHKSLCNEKGHLFFCACKGSTIQQLNQWW